MVVLYEPKFNPIVHEPRKFKTVHFRPLPESKIAAYGTWLKNQSWHELYQNNDVNFKAEYLQDILMAKFYELFPLKSMKISEDDEPWFSDKLKKLDRCRKREYFRHQKSQKWQVLNKQFLDELKLAKESYRKKILDDLKTSKPGQWY